VTEYLNPPRMQLVPTNDNLSSPRYLVEPIICWKWLRETMVNLWKIQLIDFGKGGLAFLVINDHTNSHFVAAFFSGNRPTEIHTPLFIRAPEFVFIKMSFGAVDQDCGSSIDAWSPIMSLYDDDVNHLFVQKIKNMSQIYSWNWVVDSWGTGEGLERRESTDI
jgi:hypothetical protein